MLCDMEEQAALPNQLTGALIGLARATEGNEYLLSRSTAQVVIEALSADADIDSAALEALMEQVTGEKRRLVPGCFDCADPCGRTDDYDMERLQYANEEIRSLKFQILSGIQSAARYACRAAEGGSWDDSIFETFYKALFAVGMEAWGREELLPIVAEVRHIDRKCRKLLHGE